MAGRQQVRTKPLLGVLPHRAEFDVDVAWQVGVGGEAGLEPREEGLKHVQPVLVDQVHLPAPPPRSARTARRRARGRPHVVQRDTEAAAHVLRVAPVCLARALAGLVPLGPRRRASGPYRCSRAGRRWGAPRPTTGRAARPHGTPARPAAARRSPSRRHPRCRQPPAAATPSQLARACRSVVPQCAPPWAATPAEGQGGAKLARAASSAAQCRSRLRATTVPPRRHGLRSCRGPH